MSSHEYEEYGRETVWKTIPGGLLESRYSFHANRKFKRADELVAFAQAALESCKWMDLNHGILT